MNKDKYYKVESYKISKLSNDSTVSKFVPRKQIEVVQNRIELYSVNKNVMFIFKNVRFNLKIKLL